MSTVSSAGLAQYNTKPVTNRQNRQADRIATAISLYTVFRKKHPLTFLFISP